MNRFVARENIRHWRERLALEPDEKTCQTLVELIAKEEAKLALLEKQQGDLKKEANAPSIHASGSDEPQSSSES